jgi:eukaryotic-like serine/threonine-protein kinase
MSASLFDRSAPLSRRGASAADLGLKPGDVVAGKYRLESLIGEGGMGYVLAATHVELGELVALKFLRPEALQFEELLGRFAREAQASARIKSEHVARVYDVGTTPIGIPYIVMEHLQGQDLATLMASGKRLSVETAVEYVMQACEGVASAHALGIVHRDIKPENLFLTQAAPGSPSVVKLLDFGISKVDLTTRQVPQNSRGMAQTTALLGSPRYMSPEQIRNSTQVDGRADIWALGCVLYELLAAHPAFDAPSIMELGAAILGDEPVPVRVLANHVAPELDAIVTRCLQKRPEARFRNVAELAAALYPFGPRRARMFAERCHSLLQCVHPELAKLELLSISPPSSVSSTTLDIAAIEKASPVVPRHGGKAKRAFAALVVTAAAVVGGIYVASPEALQPENFAVLATSIQEGLSSVPGAAAQHDVPAMPGHAPDDTLANALPVATSTVSQTGAASVSAASAASSAAVSAAEPAAHARPRARVSAWRPPAAAPKPVPPPAPRAPAEPDVGF